jgi:hypothetical protein
MPKTFAASTWVIPLRTARTTWRRICACVARSSLRPSMFMKSQRVTALFGAPISKLSLRDLVAMMAERGLALAHTTIMHWVQRFVHEFVKRWNRFARKAGTILARRRELFEDPKQMDVSLSCRRSRRPDS